MADDALPSRIVAGISFIGRGGGAVKTLAGFRKGRHTLPDAVNPATTAFLARLCAPDLADEAEKLFQAARLGLEYRRKDIALAVTGASATIGAKDFTVEISYALEEREPARYIVTTILNGLSDLAVARSEPVGRIFAGRFSEISFGLNRGASVEAVIDAIEGLNGDSALRVDYPSDYRHCTIRVSGVAPAVRCNGSALEMIFPRAGAPGELIEAFIAVRGAFQISKALRGLID